MSVGTLYEEGARVAVKLGEDTKRVLLLLEREKTVEGFMNVAIKHFASRGITYPEELLKASDFETGRLAFLAGLTQGFKQ